MYIMMWPEERFVLSRIIRVKGRISWEKISTRGKKIISAVGAPKGNICATKDFIWVLKTQRIIGAQNKSLILKVKL